MGDLNQLIWVKENKDRIKGPILEIGSRFYKEETSINYRELFPGVDYASIDFTGGNNVDIVIDITAEIDEVKNKLGNKSFQCIICNSVLEHVDNIFRAAGNIQELLSKDGILFLSVPFIWEEHGYPNDFWRFTPNGIKFLFQGIKFIDEISTYSSETDHDIKPFSLGTNGFIYNEEIFYSDSSIRNMFIRRITRAGKFFRNKEFRFEYLKRKIQGKRTLFKKCSINMYGIK